MLLLQHGLNMLHHIARFWGRGWQSDRERRRKRETDISTIHRITLQMSATPRIGPGQPVSWNSMQVSRVNGMDSRASAIICCLADSLAGKWIGIRVAVTTHTAVMLPYGMCVGHRPHCTFMGSAVPPHLPLTGVFL